VVAESGEVAAVPEPTTIMLVSGGLLFLVRWRKKAKTS
jgi:hypothetical protein